MNYKPFYLSKLDESNGYSRLLELAYKEVSGKEKDLEQSMERADRVISIMLKLVESYKGLPVAQESHYQKWAEILIAAGYLYFMFYDELMPFSSLMRPREVCTEECKKFIPPGELEFIFGAVEACGGNTGIQKLKAAPDTPHEMLVLAVWLEKNKEGLFKPVTD